MALSPLPALDRTSPTFKTDLDAYFLTALPAFSTEANALQADVAAKQSTASTAATTATTQAGNAATSATTASDSAITATTQAELATTQAGNSATSATAASGSAATATTQAGIATTKAGEALASASAAAASAVSIAGGPVASINGMTGVVTGIATGTGTASGTNTGDQDLSAYATKTGVETLTNKTIHGNTNTLTADGTNAVGFRHIPQLDKTSAYTLILDDAGKHVHKGGATAYTATIPANSSVAFPIGTAITFVNSGTSGAMTIAITTDTMRLAGAGTTGSRTLAAYGVATAVKVTSTLWMISGSGLT